jgi:hypothetical protein
MCESLKSRKRLFSYLFSACLICFFCSSCELTQNLKGVFVNSDIKEKWVDLESYEKGYYTKALNNEWAIFTSESLCLKGKIRKTILEGDERYDFAFTVNAKLTHPELKSDFENKIVDRYYFDFNFYFIDEDGFIIHKFKPNEYFSEKHEKNENYISWTSEKYPEEEIYITTIALLKGMIPAKIGERVHKITYISILRAEIKDKDEKKNVFEIIDEKNKKKKDIMFKLLTENYDESLELEKISNKTIKE